MKQIIYLLLMILMVTNVSALIAGTNSTVTTIPKCEFVFVNVTGSLIIDAGEYSFIGCDEVEKDYWYCNCTDNYNLVMSIDYRAINNYTINTNAFYPGSINTGSGGGSSSGSTIIYKLPVNETEVVEEPVVEEPIVDVIEEPIVEEPVVEVVNETIVEEPVVVQKSSLNWWLIIAIIGIIIFLILVTMAFVYVFK